MDNGSQCLSLLDAIRDNGIDDLTRWISIQVALILGYSLLTVIGMIGNGSVLIAFANNSRLRSARNIFLLNLIITDLILCVTSVPFTLWYGLSKTWLFGELMCRLLPLSNSCSVFVTSYSLTAIAVDKFVHIMDPTKAPVSARQAVIVTALIWMLSTMINIPFLLSFGLVDGSYYVPKNSTPFCGQFCEEVYWPGETAKRIYGSAVVLLQFFVPLTMITYCYSLILKKVSKDMIIQNVQFSRSLTTAQREEASNRRKKVNYILIGMVVAFSGCWLPITVVNILRDFNMEPWFIRKQPYIWPLATHALAMSTVIWNPLLFFWLTRKSKRPKLARFSASIDALSSMFARMSTLRRISTLRSGQSNTSDNSTVNISRDRTIERMNKTELPEEAPKCRIRNGLSDPSKYLANEVERLI